MKKFRIIVLALMLALCLSACAAEPVEPPICAQDVPVNIEGFIDEVGADGKSFRIGDLWVIVDENTAYGYPDSDPASAEAYPIREFRIGHVISGYTEDDPASGTVYALRIYTNLGVVE